MSRLVVGGMVCVLVVLPGCGGQKHAGPAKGKPAFAYITNGVADFWEHARAGAEAAGKDLDVDVTVIMPSGVTDQTRKVEDLLTRGTDGIAISPVNSGNQVELINRAAKQTILITHDCDAQQTDRLVYIGMVNYRAGLMAGQALREALPDGGAVMIFLGRMDQDNGKERRAGFIDGLLEYQLDPTHNYPPGEELSSAGNKFTVLGTMTDQFDRAKAKANVEDALNRYPDLAGMVGMFGYNPPMILEALRSTGKLGKIKVLGFDEDDATLQAVKDGNLVATVVQNPYQYGYQSIQVLNELHKGNRSIIPESKFIDIPARLIDKSKVDEFWQEIKDQLSKK